LLLESNCRQLAAASVETGTMLSGENSEGRAIAKADKVKSADNNNKTNTDVNLFFIRDFELFLVNAAFRSPFRAFVGNAKLGPAGYAARSDGNLVVLIVRIATIDLHRVVGRAQAPRHYRNFFLRKHLRLSFFMCRQKRERRNEGNKNRKQQYFCHIKSYKITL